MLSNVVPLELVGGSRRHEKHHHNGAVHYQKFFTWLDELCGTVAHDE